MWNTVRVGLQFASIEWSKRGIEQIFEACVSYCSTFTCPNKRTSHAHELVLLKNSTQFRTECYSMQIKLSRI